MKLLHVDGSSKESEARVQKLIDMYTDSSLHAKNKDNKPSIVPLPDQEEETSEYQKV